MTPAVREAAAGDVAALLPLLAQFYDEAGFEYEIDVMAARLEQILVRSDTAAFVADAETTVVGVATVSTAYGLEAGLYAELEDIFVRPESRGRGVGEALFQAVVEWAGSRGCRDVEVVLTPPARDNAQLVAWYVARGFEDTGRCIFERRFQKA